ncbi:MAG: transglutaminase family protein, partial [Methylovulum sp.]|nr:transglutaminase family protein [Methylovulum sp.]
MKLRVACHLSFQIDAGTALILMLRPYQGNQQWIIQEQYEVNQMISVLESRDSFGNACQRLVAPMGDLTITVTADVKNYLQPTNYEHYFVEIQCLPA